MSEQEHKYEPLSEAELVGIEYHYRDYYDDDSPASVSILATTLRLIATIRDLQGQVAELKKPRFGPITGTGTDFTHYGPKEEGE